MAVYRIASLSEVPQHLETVARWTHAEWGAPSGRSLRDTTDWFHGILRNPREECVVAVAGDEALGLACLVDHDLESRPDLRHWLASVFVPPEQRGQGIARDLVMTIERLAARHGIPRLHLYTRSAEGLYEKLGWTTDSHFTLDGHQFTLMTKPPA